MGRHGLEVYFGSAKDTVTGRREVPRKGTTMRSPGAGENWEVEGGRQRYWRPVKVRVPTEWMRGLSWA